MNTINKGTDPTLLLIAIAMIFLSSVALVFGLWKDGLLTTPTNAFEFNDSIGAHQWVADCDPTRPCKVNGQWTRLDLVPSDQQ